MNVNPLFPSSSEPADNNSYLLQRQDKSVEPVGHTEVTGTNEAVNLIRQKIEHIYADEPDPLQEEQKAETSPRRSRHQQFMYELSNSGKSLAEIQTEWHNYYAGLADDEKHQVWQEFYESNNSRPTPYAPTGSPTGTPAAQQAAGTPLPAEHQLARRPPYEPRRTASRLAAHMPAVAPATVVSSLTQAAADNRSMSQLRELVRNKVSAGGRLQAKHHLQSLGFGLAVGLTTLVIFLFGFFNEVIIAPFIQPGRAAGATPIIIDPAAIATSATTPEIIIPKINLEIPVDFTQTSTNESDIENALESGIVHYPTTVMPGQLGNTAYFGHSSNNIFNPGKYKFAFVLLHELVPGDTFYITYNGKAYVYKVFDKKIVPPTEISVLSNVPGHTATATLITCDPPGTSINRLVVVGDQVSPDPSGNAEGANTTTTVTQSTQLPGNGPSLLSRIWNSLF